MKPVPKQITRMTGISQTMIDDQREPLEKILGEFTAFISNLPLVTIPTVLSAIAGEPWSSIVPPSPSLAEQIENSLSVALS
jgi:hypothetical protein